MRKFFKLLIPATGMLIASQVASAAQSFSFTAAGTLSVSVSVPGTCTVSTTPLSFPSIASGTLAVNTDGQGGISVSCTGANIPVALQLGAGNGTGATTTARKMMSGTNVLAYGLYQTPARTANWGNTLGTDTVATTTGASSTPVSLAVYGRIPAGTSVPANGVYTDTVSVTLNY